MLALLQHHWHYWCSNQEHGCGTLAAPLQKVEGQHLGTFAAPFWYLTSLYGKYLAFRICAKMKTFTHECGKILADVISMRQVNCNILALVGTAWRFTTIKKKSSGLAIVSWHFAAPIGTLQHPSKKEILSDLLALCSTHWHFAAPFQQCTFLVLLQHLGPFGTLQHRLALCSTFQRQKNGTFTAPFGTLWYHFA